MIYPNNLSNWYDIQIYNGGKPILPELSSKLARPFYTTKFSGTGLGLAIVKRLVEAHSGKLFITSSALHCERTLATKPKLSEYLALSDNLIMISSKILLLAGGEMPVR